MDIESFILISEIFDNYRKFSVHQRCLLELKILHISPWRYFQYTRQNQHHTIGRFLKACLLIEFGKNTSFLTKLIFPFILFIQIIKAVLLKDESAKLFKKDYISIFLSKIYKDNDVKSWDKD